MKLGRIIRKKNDTDVRLAAQLLYQSAMESARHPVFYKDYAVPDSFDGRFDMLLVHVFIILFFLKQSGAHEPLSQALYEHMFEDIEQGLREASMSDSAVVRHIKPMMRAFTGRMSRYQAAINLNEGALESALRDNVYGTCSMRLEHNVKALALYIRHNIDDKSALQIEKISQGHIVFTHI